MKNMATMKTKVSANHYINKPLIDQLEHQGSGPENWHFALGQATPIKHLLDRRSALFPTATNKQTYSQQ